MSNLERNKHVYSLVQKHSAFIIVQMGVHVQQQQI